MKTIILLTAALVALCTVSGPIEPPTKIQSLGDCGPIVHVDAFICLIGSTTGGGGTGIKGNPTIMRAGL